MFRIRVRIRLRVSVKVKIKVRVSSSSILPYCRSAGLVRSPAFYPWPAGAVFRRTEIT